MISEDADVEVLEAIAKNGTMDYEKWPALIEPFLEQLRHIAHTEFPTLRVRSNSIDTVPLNTQSAYASQDPNSQANSNKENAPPSQTQLQSPHARPPVPSFSPESSIRVPDSQSQTSHDDTPLPVPLEAMLASIESTLRRDFSLRPPHTIQRLVELVLRPTRHYKTLPAYLRAVDRVVSVSSGADVFPLSFTTPHNVMVDNQLSNGINGVTSFSLFGDSSLGSDESLGGALLTPIPWLNSAMSAHAGESLMFHHPGNGPLLHHGGIFQEQHRPLETPIHGTDTEDPASDETTPHARGPPMVGVGDIGLQDGKDVEMALLTSGPDVSSQEPLLPQETQQDKGDENAGQEGDTNGRAAADDASIALEAQNSTPSAQVTDTIIQEGGGTENEDNEITNIGA
ncbi:DNA repair protein rad50 [Ophidiomyces ophidiicola]|nr:DNA repair protein rad50 [Ophidiomyces ophidiicola]